MEGPNTTDAVRVDAIPGAETKATILRGYSAVLAERGMLARVCDRVSAETALLLRTPPLATTWIPRARIYEVQRAIELLFGAAEVRAVARGALQRSLLPVLRPALESMLRLFGVSPVTLFSALQRLMRSSTRGLEIRFEPMGDRAGRLVFHLPSETSVPFAFFIAQQGSVDVVFDLLSVRGNVGEPRAISGMRGTCVCLSVSW